ncbi:YybH family protein [Hoeflea prorocentri]|uniref:Nuclear transport factor 2 family protein n=1 Tax=Hoeflea prorocentri TaxID=1922333 RepID=A0A9X3UKW7_9HYPH|nr:nuclear transport factor 2 family protein [Hoeflea prorocentri]MCY6383162.1 nuclear transport factor 2 family protein [Hoeflea prorocentri]MDA5400962.1 nuclear transport factor 2 family protein [Hoeflea prorocentri]
MSDVEDIKHALNEWLEGLDSGDIERMIRTVDPDVVTCNEHQPTGYGIAAIREKYAPRIEASTFKSGFDLEHIQVFEGFAMIIGHFTVEVTDKTTGHEGGGQGRLLLVYRKHDDGWKMLIDIDNNDDKS